MTIFNVVTTYRYDLIPINTAMFKNIYFTLVKSKINYEQTNDNTDDKK